ncbi:MAG: hypothetical protein WCO25_02715 [Candidatus Uhrbacteria bacterium]
MPDQSSRPSTGPLTDDERATLVRGGFDPVPRDYGDDDPALRYQRFCDEIVTTALTPEDAAVRLKVPVAAVWKLIGDRTLCTIHSHGRVSGIPAFQFLPDGGGLVPGIGEVSRAIPSPVTVFEIASWLVVKHPDLVVGEEETPLTPLEWLAAGHDPSVAAQLAEGEFLPGFLP